MTLPHTETRDSTREESPLLEDLNEVNVSYKYSSRSIISMESARLSVRSMSSTLMEKVTSSGRDLALNNLGIGPAVHLIREAVRGEKESPYEAWYDPYTNPNQPARNFFSVLCSRLIAYQWMVLLLRTAVWTLVVLSFVEPPSWCQGSDLHIAQGHADEKFGTCGILLSASGTASNGEEHAEYYPNSSSMWLTVNQSRNVEWACLSIISIFMIFHFGRDGFELGRFFFPGYNRRINGIRCLLLAILYASVISNKSIYSPFFRLILLGTWLKRFQKELRSLVKMLPQVMNILAILGILIIFYAWFGVVIFYDSPQGKRDFPNLLEGCWTLWICVTTANYPDVMMLSYNDNRLSAIFFISFMTLSFFFLMNLILASVVNAYDEVIDHRKESRKEISRENLAKAFELMDPNKTGRISREKIMALFLVLNEDVPEIHKLSDDETKLLFGILDKDGSSTITLEEFRDFASVLLLEFTKESEYATFIQVHFTKLYGSPEYQQFCNIVRSKSFEHIVDLLLFLNAVVISIQSYPELTGQDVQLDPHYSDGYVDTVWELMETMFTVLYVMEVCVKVMVVGWKEYRESPRNLFDFVVTISALFATGYVYYPNAYNDSRLIRYIVMARVLRLGRLLMSIHAFQVIGSISAEILPAATNVIMLLFFLMYWFAALGMIMYGGMITRDPSNPLSGLILDNDFSNNDYWANNFNDMMSGMNVLFNLLVVNNWTNCEIGFEAVTGGKWVRIFFLSFHVLGVMLVNNLVIAFIINAFFQQLTALNARSGEEVVEGEAVIRGERAIFDGAEITGTRTGASGGYIARIRAIHADVEIDEREGLRRLFTQSSNDEE